MHPKVGSYISPTQSLFRLGLSPLAVMRVETSIERVGIHTSDTDVGVLSESRSHPSLPCASVAHLCNGGNSISKVMHINTYGLWYCSPDMTLKIFLNAILLVKI